MRPARCEWLGLGLGMGLGMGLGLGWSTRVLHEQEVLLVLLVEVIDAQPRLGDCIPLPPRDRLDRLE